jgi:hypothetical protein
MLLNSECRNLAIQRLQNTVRIVGMQMPVTVNLFEIVLQSVNGHLVLIYSELDTWWCEHAYMMPKIPQNGH